MGIAILLILYIIDIWDLPGTDKKMRADDRCFQGVVHK